MHTPESTAPLSVHTPDPQSTALTPQSATLTPQSVALQSDPPTVPPPKRACVDPSQDLLQVKKHVHKHRYTL